MPEPESSKPIERVDRPSEAYQRYLADIKPSEELRAMMEQADRIAELADRVEGKWRKRTWGIFTIAIVISVFVGFLLADYFQLRLFSTSPQALIDGRVPTEREISVIRGMRKQRDKMLAQTAVAPSDKEGDHFAKRMELTQQALAIATTEFPEDKEKRLARFRELVGTPTNNPIDDLQRIADRIKEATLKEGQTNVSSGNSSGADIR